MGRCLTALLILCLAACSSGYRAPVEVRHDRTRASKPVVYKAPSTYAVKKGDTLYSIAWRFGLDYRRLAALNGIGRDYAIYPGQRLRLKGRLPTRSQSAKRKPKRTAPSAATKKPASKPVVPRTTKTRPKPKVKPKPKPRSRPKSTSAINWRWPSTGKVVRRFSSTVHKGIDLSGNRGDAVTAAAAGEVVYAGSGIVGLGNLVIVKHNERYLSAYGHNDKLLVREGSKVKAGQTIARKGNSGTDNIKLHFEIRQEGRPIDPLRLLPRR